MNSDASISSIPLWDSWSVSSVNVAAELAARKLENTQRLNVGREQDLADRATLVRSVLIRCARYLRQEYLLAGEHRFSQGFGPVLALLERFGPLTPTMLARYSYIQRPAVTRLLVQFGQDGLIETAPSDDDARSHKVRITERGRARLRGTRVREHALLSHFVAQLSPKQMTVLKDAAVLLTRFSGIRDKAVVLPKDRLDIAAYLRLMIVYFVRHHLRQNTPLDLGPTCGGILAQLQRSDRMLPSDLARRECISRASLTQVLSQLGQAGWLVVQPDDLDARSSLVSISDEGRNYFSRLLAQHDALIFSLMQGLSAAKADVLHEACLILHQSLKQLAPDSVSD